MYHIVIMSLNFKTASNWIYVTSVITILIFYPTNIADVVIFQYIV